MPKNSALFDAVSVADMRRKSGAKWQRYGDDVLGSWVAEMDFQLAAPIHATLREQPATIPVLSGLY